MSDRRRGHSLDCGCSWCDLLERYDRLLERIAKLEGQPTYEAGRADERRDVVAYLDSLPSDDYSASGLGERIAEGRHVQKEGD